MEDGYETFTEREKQILDRYVTNTSGHIFVLRNLPEVIKGALFSRYSRSSLGLRSLLLKEFIGNNEETSFEKIAGNQGIGTEEEAEEQLIAIKKAQKFYDRILDGYGDDSIGELGGAHLAIENVSMIAAKVIEDARIGGSPLEKSTRYIYFDQKVNGEYLFYREPVLMTSAYRELYLKTCNQLFETYSKLIPPMTEMMEKNHPKDSSTSKVAYNAAVRAKVLDCLRGLLPASTLTNMGIYGNGRFFESLIHKLHTNNLAEIQQIGKRAYDELFKVIPSFIRRSNTEHRHHKSFAEFTEAMKEEINHISEVHQDKIPTGTSQAVKLVDYTDNAPRKVAASLLFSESGKSLDQVLEYCNTLSEEEIARILEAGCSVRNNRRHKSPRALEHAEFTFEIVSDFGSYRDLQRHRILTQERQLLSCDHDYYLPSEIIGTPMESEYHQAMKMAKNAYDTICHELPEEAQYIVPMGFNIRWYFHVNLRSIQWMSELRSAPQGHASYRHTAQEIAQQVIQVYPEFERFLKFVDYEGYELGRLDQEKRNAKKKEKLFSQTSS